MINGLGIVGWGVGGIEAEAGMLGQPVYFLTPEVVGVHMSGRLREGVTATDLALHVTQLLRARKVVGKFVEFYGEGAGSLPLFDRATIGNMAPEYGATMGFFPVDSESVNYLRMTGRSEEACERFENYFKAQGMFGMPKKGEIEYSVDIDLDLATVQPSVSGPKRPQDRINLGGAGPDIPRSLCQTGHRRRIRKKRGTFVETNDGFGERFEACAAVPSGGKSGEVGHGSVLIAAITSCTNTSNPSVMLGAGLLAKKAVEKGLTVNPTVKTSMAPGFTSGDRLSCENRAAALPGSARIQYRGIRLHHLHRELRSAPSEHRTSGDRQRFRRCSGPFGQSKFRGAHSSEYQSELSDVASAGRCVCVGRTSEHRHGARADRHR